MLQPHLATGLPVVVSEVGMRTSAGASASGAVDPFSPLLAPTLINDRRSKARTRHRAVRLLEEAGFTAPIWHKRYTPIINAVVAAAG